MSKRPMNNVAASVRQKLMNQARERKEDFNLVLTRYGLERLLYRLSRSPHNERFILKGAMLFQLWNGPSHRPTRDLDLLGHGEPTPESFVEIFQEICSCEVGDDGIVFDPTSVQGEQIKDDQEYQGLRMRLIARLASARIPIQVDIGFGDAITPGPHDVTYPTILDFEAPRLKAYPRETVVAEKFQAMVLLGIANSRMKDFYDLWILSQQFEFAGPSLSQAIAATFDRRGTKLPEATPLALTGEFAEDRQKQTQWKAFLRKNQLGLQDQTFTEITAGLSKFLLPPLEVLMSHRQFDQTWSPGGPWHQSKSEATD